MPNNFVQSGYERKENDDYQTLDPRCIHAIIPFLSSDLLLRGLLKDKSNADIVDMCGSHGSGIVRELNNQGFRARPLPEAFTDISADWIITNPPYDRNVVDSFVAHGIRMVKEKKVYGATFLMRASWDFASSRAHMFDNPLYYGQIRMRFRPWWTESRKAQPIHNYVWHIWQNRSQDELLRNDCREPRIIYWPKQVMQSPN